MQSKHKNTLENIHAYTYRNIYNILQRGKHQVFKYLTLSRHPYTLPALQKSLSTGPDVAGKGKNLLTHCVREENSADRPSSTRVFHLYSQNRVKQGTVVLYHS